MLKLVYRQARGKPPRQRGKAPDPAARLCEQIEHERTMGQATQRAVAVGRRTIVDAHCCLQRVLAQHAGRGAFAVPEKDRAQAVAGLASQLEAIHERLLLFSSSVELEIDRLEMLCTEVEQLVGGAGAGGVTS